MRLKVTLTNESLMKETTHVLIAFITSLQVCKAMFYQSMIGTSGSEIRWVDEGIVARVVRRFPTQFVDCNQNGDLMEFLFDAHILEKMQRINTE